MTLFRQKSDRVKNPHRDRLETDFYFNHFSWMVLGFFTILAGIIAWLLQTPRLELAVLGALPLLAVVMMLLPFWTLVLGEVLVYWALCFALAPTAAPVLGGLGTLALLGSTSLHIVYQWDKALVLRMGRFHRVEKPGAFFIIPLFERVADYVDTRIRVTDFTSEKTISQDTVPLEVDALCFWMVWDPRKAILEVENFEEAVTLGAQTALRDAIGRHDLADILSRKDKVGEEIKTSLEQKMNDWGITIFSIEFTDITLPKELEEALSRKAQAEREKQGRLILAQAEKEAAEVFSQAAAIYGAVPGGLQLRGMNMVYEGLKNPHNTLMVVPTPLMETLDTGSLLGFQALAKTKEMKQEEKK